MNGQKIAFEITSIEMRTDIGNTPARINFKTGALFVNAKIWPTLSDDEKAAVVLHELGHVKLKTKIETEADKFATDEYKAKGLSSKAFLKTFGKLLDVTDPAHLNRINQIIKNLAIKEYEAGNTEILNKLITIKKDHMKYNNMCVDWENCPGFDGDGNLVDFGKALQHRLDNKLKKGEVKQQLGQMKDTYGRRGIAVRKHDAIDYKRMAKGDQLKAKGESEVILANQGIQKKSATEGVIGSVADAVVKVVGGTQTEPAPAPAMDAIQASVGDYAPSSGGGGGGGFAGYRSMAPSQDEQEVDSSSGGGNDNGAAPKKKGSGNMILYIGLGVLALLVIGGGIMYATKSSK